MKFSFEEILFNDRFDIIDKVFYISGNEETLIKKLEKQLIDRFYKLGIRHVERLDSIEEYKENSDLFFEKNLVILDGIKGIKIEKSLKMLERANNLKSDDPFIIDSLGWALFKMKKYVASKNYLQSAVKLMPDDPVINDHYGDVLWKNGNKIQARYFWKYVLNLKETEKDMKQNIKDKLISGL